MTTGCLFMLSDRGLSFVNLDDDLGLDSGLANSAWAACVA